MQGGKVDMNLKDFVALIKTEHKVSCKMLQSKGREYTGKDTNRLIMFKEAVNLTGTNPANALVGMVVKQWVSIVRMARCPHQYTMDQWDEKLRDARNYTYLLKAVLVDMEIKSGKTDC